MALTNKYTMPKQGGIITLNYSFKDDCSNKNIVWSEEKIIEEPIVSPNWYSVVIDENTSSITISSNSADNVKHTLLFTPTVNGNDCENLIVVEQNADAGDVCKCIDTFNFSTVSSDGVAANTIVGKIVVTENCNVELITFSSSDLSLVVDSNGNIKTVNAIAANSYEEPKNYTVKVLYDGSECFEGLLVQDGIVIKCGCDTSMYYIDTFNGRYPKSGTSDTVMIASGHSECGYLAPSSQSSMFENGNLTYTIDENGFYFWGKILENIGASRSAGITFTLLDNYGHVIEQNCNVGMVVTQYGDNSITGCTCDKIDSYKNYNLGLRELYEPIPDGALYYSFQHIDSGYIYHPYLRFGAWNWDDVVNRFGRNGDHKIKLTFDASINVCTGGITLHAILESIDEHIQNLFDIDIEYDGPSDVLKSMTFYPKTLTDSQKEQYFNSISCDDIWANAYKIMFSNRLGDYYIQKNGDWLYGEKCDAHKNDLYAAFFFDKTPFCNVYPFINGEAQPNSEIDLSPLGGYSDTYWIGYYAGTSWLSNNNLYEEVYNEDTGEWEIVHPSWITVERINNETYPDCPTYRFNTTINDTGYKRCAKVVCPNDACPNGGLHEFIQICQPSCECGKFTPYSQAGLEEGDRRWFCDGIDESIVWQREYCMNAPIAHWQYISGFTTDPDIDPETHWTLRGEVNLKNKAKVLAKPNSALGTNDGTYVRAHWQLTFGKNESISTCPDTHKVPYDDLILEHYDCKEDVYPDCTCTDYTLVYTDTSNSEYINSSNTITVGTANIVRKSDKCNETSSIPEIVVSTTQGNYISVGMNGNYIEVTIIGNKTDYGAQTVTVDINTECDGQIGTQSAVISFTLIDPAE
jgi:hypothetical protein